MHHIYHTEGIILSSRNSGESGRYYAIFTRDLGMVYASASGVRKSSSKLRYVLQDFSYIKLDLVKGRDFWRLTNASKTNMLEDILKNKEALKVYSNINKLLKRLLAGEDPNPPLFHDVLSGLIILEKETKLEEIRNVEVVLVLRILSNLGYIGAGVELENVIKSPLESELIFGAGKIRGEILKEINKALKETHL